MFSILVPLVHFSDKRGPYECLAVRIDKLAKRTANEKMNNMCIVNDYCKQFFADFVREELDVLEQFTITVVHN